MGRCLNAPIGTNYRRKSKVIKIAVGQNKTQREEKLDDELIKGWELISVSWNGTDEWFYFTRIVSN